MRPCHVLFLLPVTLLAAGCQKRVNLEKTVSLTVGAVEVPAIVDAPRGEQKVRATIAAADPVDVHIVLEANRAAVMEALTSAKKVPADKVLASKEKVKSDTLAATIPAGKEYAVVLSGATKTTEVKLTLKSE